MTSDTRLFQFCLLASLLINSLGLLLAGWLWQPVTWPLPVSYAHIKLLAPRLPVPRPATPARPVRLAKSATPVQRPKPPAPPRPRKRFRPGTQRRSSQPAPLTRPTGGAQSGTSAPPPVAAALPPRALAVITSEHSSPLTVPQSVTPPSPASVPVPVQMPIQAVTATPAALPAASPAATEGQSAGKTVGGKSVGGGEGAMAGRGVGAGKSEEAGEPFGVGQGMAGDGGLRHVVYVLDISGSMSSRIESAEEELRRALSGLQPGETFNIVAFSDHIQPFDTGMAPATEEMERRAVYFLSTLQVSGGTDLEGAMTEALNRPNVNEVVVLTDGVPTQGETDFKTLARRIREMNRNHARISTVGLVGKNPDGTDDSFEATHLLQQIAHDSGGASKLVSLGIASP